jgi:hypothetical protein
MGSSIARGPREVHRERIVNGSVNEQLVLTRTLAPCQTEELGPVYEKGAVFTYKLLSYLRKTSKPCRR